MLNGKSSKQGVFNGPPIYTRHVKDMRASEKLREVKWEVVPPDEKADGHASGEKTAEGGNPG